MADLSTSVAGIRLENPLMLASGILDENGYTMLDVMNNGAAAVVTKSIGMEERNGYSAPVIVEYGDSLINAVGLSNPGIDNFAEEIRIAKRSGKPVIGSVFASDAESFVNLGRKMQEYGCDAVELNLSCPHVKGFGLEVGSDPDLVEDIVNEMKSKISVPVFAKLSPNVSDIIEIAKAAEKADAYVLINTVKAMKIDIRARMPVLTNAYGGLSGPAIKPVGVRYVYEVKKETGKDIIGVGGITTYEDAVEYIMAGASAVQIGTALYTVGKSVFRNIISQMNTFMDDEKFHSIQDMVGVAIR
ncbi:DIHYDROOROTATE DEHYDROGENASE B related protein [Thermoplasma acidophilum]|uniref:Dihydroorotate dehydrogenase B (NAD(+)), catalytic subunit n=1 Tax=Thermoplasma acidophilum (strain ATCC 25905 / DSM 1728 / JCM 9062 / NBRC 15155 / AMRC-C165) TaxID=273075 RepID=PYRDB_THEAC|nr:dihydroorotate dehydrogenase [Thermoplasma acidophilum]Q9HL35.1 RecName: Full=Dihydroorotate dehydrogenase B (NAD(+)), catalytic subunit; Short=DHOD B; Short=DHODase B; Short=DHOdehase B; AltName: Full=Dihydroorotate oxidase B; AltName: Full=Orotate reductase (NADH) [Thermoplasma acidophilum DSM 1728]MCY0851293.1 dihydroorotate dehydrogenase [Thermoplasma acidophilum]CAC11547.1 DIHYDROOROTATE DEHYDROGENASE B related protein [Thermoplasma acidophilum]